MWLRLWCVVISGMEPMSGSVLVWGNGDTPWLAKNSYSRGTRSLSLTSMVKVGHHPPNQFKVFRLRLGVAGSVCKNAKIIVDYACGTNSGHRGALRPR